MSEDAKPKVDLDDILHVMRVRAVDYLDRAADVVDTSVAEASSASNCALAIMVMRRDLRRMYAPDATKAEAADHG